MVSTQGTDPKQNKYKFNKFLELYFEIFLK